MSFGQYIFVPVLKMFVADKQEQPPNKVDGKGKGEKIKVIPVL
jgi:hypothetical protein